MVVGFMVGVGGREIEMGVVIFLIDVGKKLGLFFKFDWLG